MKKLFPIMALILAVVALAATYLPSGTALAQSESFSSGTALAQSESFSGGRAIFEFGDSALAQFPISTLQEFPSVKYWLLPSSYDAIRDYYLKINNFVVLRTFKRSILDALNKDLGISKCMLERMGPSCFIALGDFSSQLPLHICLRRTYDKGEAVSSIL